jgi:hypothetical protein
MMRHRIRLASWKVILGTGVLAGWLALFGATPSAKADDCQERISKADHRLHEAAGIPIATGMITTTTTGNG